MALAASRADDVETMRIFFRDLANIVEREIPQNESLLRAIVDLGARDLGGADGLAPANVGYTGFLLATATQHGPLEVMAAILPCTWSYGEIAENLLGDVEKHPVYAEWIRFFGSPDYGEVVSTMQADFERLAARAEDVPIEALSELFTLGARLEAAFWDMAYGLEHWPDVRARYPVG